MNTVNVISEIDSVQIEKQIKNEELARLKRNFSHSMLIKEKVTLIEQMQTVQDDLATIQERLNDLERKHQKKLF